MRKWTKSSHHVSRLSLIKVRVKFSVASMVLGTSLVGLVANTPAWAYRFNTDTLITANTINLNPLISGDGISANAASIDSNASITTTSRDLSTIVLDAAGNTGVIAHSVASGDMRLDTWREAVGVKTS